MTQQKNVPYRKTYDEQGRVIGSFPYLNSHPNRQERRKELRKDRFRGNHKGNSIIIVRESATTFRAYKRILQWIKGVNKPIFHYILKK